MLYSREVDPVSFAFLCGLMDGPDLGNVDHKALTTLLGYSRKTWFNVSKVLRRVGALADRVIRLESGEFRTLGLKVRWPSALPWPEAMCGDFAELAVDQFGRVLHRSAVSRDSGAEAGSLPLFGGAPESRVVGQNVQRDGTPKNRGRVSERGFRGRFVKVERSEADE